MASPTTNGALHVPKKVLLIKNYTLSSPVDHLMVQSFQANLHPADAVLDVCCVVNGEPIPEDLTQYHLVILSGGKVNLIAADRSEIPSWANHVLDMVRRLDSDASRTAPKLLGICWGHQAIHHALGGKLAWVDQGALVGVQNVKLTPKGQTTFEQESLRIHKYHVRYVERVAPGFHPLEARNDISMSESRRILTFQGHPELTSEISQALSGEDDGTYTPTKSTDNTRDNVIVIEDVGTPHDGQLIWRYISEWALS